jgi:hypothetical protein
MSGQLFALITSILTLIVIFLLLRSYSLPEKYAAIWFVAGLTVFVFAAFPILLNFVANLLGVADPLNLLFFLAILFIFVMLMQLSLELGRTRAEMRALVQKLALSSKCQGEELP